MEEANRVGVDAVYLSTGANRHSAVADWSRNGTVTYGADTNIALWKPTDDPPRGVTRLLSGHKDVVKAVKFIPTQSGEDGEDGEDGSLSYMVSGSDDQCLILWEIKPDGGTTLRQVLHEHTAPIHCIAVVDTRETDKAGRMHRILLASGAADATVKIWEFYSRQLRLLQTIKTQPKYFPLSLALTPLGADGDAYMLASAGTKDTIQIFTATTPSGDREADGAAFEFKQQATLFGHEGWIRSLDFVWEGQPGSSDLLLASASQDKYIRLWRVRQGRELPARAPTGPGHPAAVGSGNFLPGKSPSNKAHRLKAGSSDYSITFEALLLGHDDWIYSAKWYSPPPGSKDTRQEDKRKLQLLSTSADNSLAIWEADQDSGVWVTSARLGELSKEKGATTATGSIGGFWTGVWSPTGRTVVCLGRTGSWRRWDLEQQARGDATGGGIWRQALSVSGHTKAVTGVAWFRDGRYLLSTSSDQTTRLHAEWRRRRRPASTDHSAAAAPDPDLDPDPNPSWHEMSRPQIHGYDLNCIDTLGASSFVSGAEEKLMRVFGAPKAVARLLDRLTGGSLSSGAGIDALPDAANMPVLGLSNKAVDAVDDSRAVEAPGEGIDNNTNGGGAGDREDEEEEEEEEEAGAGPVFRASTLDFDRPPYEDSLSRHTLWPEVEKLYGHGYEISCLAASHDGRLVASACRASSLNHAVIRLFETRGWTEVRPPLAAHSLTATRLAFSADDRFLLSVGRDRQWAVFERQAGAGAKAAGPYDGDAGLGYTLLQANPKGHARMILDASWALLPSSGPSGGLSEGRRRVFATAGRDKKVKIWAGGAVADADGGGGGGPPSDLAFELAATLPQDHPATAVDFLWRPVGGDKLVLAVGTEGGTLSLVTLHAEDMSVVSQYTLEPHLCSPKAILQLAWRPEGPEEEDATDAAGQAELAIAGEDSSLRIYRFKRL